jgi:ankyrin repeat protein
MNQRHNLIWRILLVAWMICGAYVLDGEAQRDEQLRRELEYEKQINELKKSMAKEQERGRIERLKMSEEEASKLVVMIQGQLGEGPTIGAGIIFGLGKDQLYIATANHVVRKGALKARDLQIKLKDLPNDFLPATLLDRADEDLDLAVVHVKGLSKHGIDGCALPIHHLGEGSVLKRGDAVYPLGYPNGAPWGMPVVPDKVAQLVGREITFQSSFISTGHSGGGLLNEDYNLVGMIRKDAPPFGLAVQIEPILKVVQQWGYPVHLYDGRYGMPPLHLAAKAGDLDTVGRLLEDECTDVSAVDNWGRTPLTYAAEGPIEVVSLLLHKGADPNRGSPLNTAASVGQIEAIKLLLARGAKVNVKDEWKSPLYTAVRNKQVEAVKLLLAAGADTARPSRLLHDALDSDKLEIVKLLFKHGADINTKYERKTLLHKAISDNKVDAVKLLIESRANIDAADDNNKWTPLHWAVSGGGSSTNRDERRLEILEILLKAGANANAPDKDNSTPLHFAVKRLHEQAEVSAVKLLLSYGANPNMIDIRGNTPLHDAVEYIGSTQQYKIETVKMLVQAGTRLDARNKDNKTPLQIARDQDMSQTRDAIINLLKSHGSKE